MSIDVGNDGREAPFAHVGEAEVGEKKVSVLYVCWLAYLASNHRVCRIGSKSL